MVAVRAAASAGAGAGGLGAVEGAASELETALGSCCLGRLGSRRRLFASRAVSLRIGGVLLRLSSQSALGRGGVRATRTRDRPALTTAKSPPGAPHGWDGVGDVALADLGSPCSVSVDGSRAWWSVASQFDLGELWREFGVT